jgi:hypothetical protein
MVSICGRVRKGPTKVDVRFGSEADLGGATNHVRFALIATAKADSRDSAVQLGMSALGQKQTFITDRNSTI